METLGLYSLDVVHAGRAKYRLAHVAGVGAQRGVVEMNGHQLGWGGGSTAPSLHT